MFLERSTDLSNDSAPSTPGLPFFLNEADANQQILATYGGYEFLKQVYTKYDPTRYVGP